MTSKELAIFCAKIAADFKASDIKILEMTKFPAISDYFVICSGESERQLQAIAYDIESKLKKNKIMCLGMEGYEQGKWILMDYVDIVVHLYLEDMRGYYELDDLWADAPHVAWEAEPVSR